MTARSAPPATSRRSTRWSRWRSRSIRAFAASPRTIRNSLPVWEYFRQIFWGSGVDLPEDGFEDMMEEVTLDSLELPAGEKAQMSLQMPEHFLIVFEPVTHAAHFIDVKGEPTKDRQTLSLIYNKVQAQDRDHRNAARVPCGWRWKTAPTRARCPRSGSPTPRCTICSPSAGRS